MGLRCSCWNCGSQKVYIILFFRREDGNDENAWLCHRCYEVWNRYERGLDEATLEGFKQYYELAALVGL